MAVQTRTNLKADQATNLADNASGDISAADLRTEFEDLTDSALLREDIDTIAELNTIVADATIVVQGGALGTPSGGTATNLTGLPISTGVSGLGTNVATFLATPSSANLLAALTTKTGTGTSVFSISPTFTGTPVLPSTFTIGGNAFTRSGAHDMTITTAGATTVTMPTTGTLVTASGSTTLSNKTISAPVLSGTITGTYTLGGTPTFPASVVTLTGTQTLTNKTIDANGTGNSITNIETADLASAAKTGSDTKVVTGTAGSANKVAMWNADGDLVEATETSLSDPGADRILGWDDSETLTAFFTPANGVEISTTNLQATTNLRTDSIQFVIDGGGSAITTGVKGYLEIPFACTIQQVSLLADQSGSIVVDVWKDTYANYPPTNTESITASAVPTISTATKAQDATLTGWTTSITAGDILGFNVDSITTCERVTIALEVLKT